MAKILLSKNKTYIQITTTLLDCKTHTNQHQHLKKKNYTNNNKTHRKLMKFTATTHYTTTISFLYQVHCDWKLTFLFLVTVHLESDLLIINYHSVFKTFSPKCQCKPNFAALCIKKNNDIIFKNQCMISLKSVLKKVLSAPAARRLKKNNLLSRPASK